MTNLDTVDNHSFFWVFSCWTRWKKNMVDREFSSKQTRKDKWQATQMYSNGCWKCFLAKIWLSPGDSQSSKKFVSVGMFNEWKKSSAWRKTKFREKNFDYLELMRKIDEILKFVLQRSNEKQSFSFSQWRTEILLRIWKTIIFFFRFIVTQ